MIDHNHWNIIKIIIQIDDINDHNNIRNYDRYKSVYIVCETVSLFINPQYPSNIHLHKYYN